MATSDDLQGFLAQGRTVNETLEIARDVAKKLIEAQEEKIEDFILVNNSFDYQLVIGI